MIQDTLSRRNNPATTSDRWHVIHARWSSGSAEAARFNREIVSEHDDREAATAAARRLLKTFVSRMATRSPEQRDQVLVRRPAYKSLKAAGRPERRA